MAGFTMAGVLPTNLSPDVRLGLLLAGAVLLFQAGRSTGPWMLLSSDPFDFSGLQFGLLSAAFGLGSLFVVGAAFWLHRQECLTRDTCVPLPLPLATTVTMRNSQWKSSTPGPAAT